MTKDIHNTQPETQFIFVFIALFVLFAKWRCGYYPDKKRYESAVLIG